MLLVAGAGLMGPVGAAATAGTAPAAIPGPAGGELIPYEKFTLANGLTVVVHTDRKAPIVAVNVWYHVGSKNEPPGKTGFAHLFEHLMYQGSEHYDDEYFKPFEQVGATSMNGTTSFDRTNYFQNVPTTALDLALWMESDRMGHLLGVVTQPRLDEQRGVVKNEKRQGENRPYGRVAETVYRASFPPGHPYRTLPIGSMTDLDAATLDDVREWFRTYYGAANAVLVLAGDIDLPTARAKTEQYFGHIAPGPAVTRPGQWIAARTDSRRETMYDQVAQPRWQRYWNTPPDNTRDSEYLGLVGEILGGGKTSRLYERLVYRERLADSASAGQSPLEIAGLFTLSADVKQGVPVARVEAAMLDELQRFIDHGPTQAELARARIAIRAGFVRGLERIGGFGGKADVLASCEVFAGDPGCYRQSLAWIDAAQPADLQRVARRWLSQGDYTLEVLPQPPHAAAAADAVDRKQGPPVTAEFPDTVFPELQRMRLSNGIPVIVAARPGVPVARISLVFDGGFVGDQDRKPGTASFAMSLLDEGAGKLDSLAIADRAERLGAQIASAAGLDTAFAAVSMMTDQADPSLALLADVVRRPTFPAHEIERVRKEWIAGIAREKASPEALALRVLPPLLYGTGHPYGIPFSGSGTEASVSALTRDDLVAYQRDFLRPDNATIIVTGAVTPESILPLLERHFGDWQPPAGAKPARVDVAAATASVGTRVYLLDRPGAPQTSILAGQLMPSSLAPDRIELNTANDVLGGTFTSRINMNLREDKHWSYGARSSLTEARGQRPWLLSAPVQTDKTVESIQEIRRELADFLAARPVTADEVSKVRSRDVRALSGQYETNAAVSGAIGDIVRFNRADDYVRTLRARLEAQTDAGVRQAAAQAFRPGSLTWVIVGDLSRIEASIRQLGLGNVQVLDADGNVLR
ncbi:MAG: insulinase family protein [Gammaproteobacteria bacterium]|nr:insulinase family protein [Gammaproteobacteria bacterium]